MGTTQPLMAATTGTVCMREIKGTKTPTIITCSEDMPSGNKHRGRRDSWPNYNNPPPTQQVLTTQQYMSMGSR